MAKGSAGGGWQGTGLSERTVRFLTTVSTVGIGFLADGYQFVLADAEGRRYVVILGSFSHRQPNVAGSTWWVLPKSSLMPWRERERPTGPNTWRGNTELIDRGVYGLLERRSFSVGPPLVDPAHPDRFKMDYEFDGEQGVVAGHLTADASLVLEVVSGPFVAPPGQASVAAEGEKRTADIDTTSDGGKK